MRLGTSAITCGAFRDYTLLVNCPGVSLNPASLPGGTVGTVYNQSVAASPAGSYNYNVTSGALPSGLTLNPASGALTGTPLVSGSYSFTITALAFGSCSGSRSYTLTVGAACVTISLPALPATGRVNVNYSGNLAATTPSANYTFSVESGTLPPSLLIDNLFGQLRGQPTAAGTYNFTLKAMRSNGCTGTRNYTVTISGGAALRVALARTADYDGDGQSDLTLWTGTNGRWQILRSSVNKRRKPLGAGRAT